MVIRVAGRSFMPRLLPTLMTAIMFVVLMGLGTWQVQRLHWKENLLAEIDAHIHETPMDIADLSGIGNFNYRPAKAAGVYQNDKNLYLFATSLQGEGGYHVLTPMKLNGGRFLLVDRGWIPYDRKGKMGSFSLPFGEVSVTGILRHPEHFWAQSNNDPEKNDWYWGDLAAMAKAAKVPFFLPYVLEVDATPNTGGFPVGGQTRVTMPNNHFVYALTWYGLALALLVVYGVSSCKRPPEGTSSE